MTGRRPNPVGPNTPDEDPLAQYAVYPVVPPLAGGIEQAHTVVTVT